MNNSHPALSLVMTQRHQTHNNITNILYCVVSNKTEAIVGKQRVNNILDLFDRSDNNNFNYRIIPQMNMYKYIYNKEFNLVEGESTTRASSYSDSLELGRGISLAREDDFRFQLHSKFLNVSGSPRLQKGLDFLNLTKEDFYQLFVVEGKNLGEIYETRRQDQPNLVQLRQKIINKIVEEETVKNDLIYSEEFNELLDIILTTNIARNSNIKFIRVEDCNSTSLIFECKQDGEGNGEVIFKEKNKIMQVTIDLNQKLMEGQDWPLLLHDIAHSVLDHPCENGFYACRTDEFVKKYNPPSVLVQQYFDKSAYQNHAQTLLPWDIEALRYSYGMPELKNVIYELSNALGLKKAFGYVIKNNAIVTLSNVGYTEIDIRNVNYYTISRI